MERLTEQSDLTFGVHGRHARRARLGRLAQLHSHCSIDHGWYDVFQYALICVFAQMIKVKFLGRCLDYGMETLVQLRKRMDDVERGQIIEDVSEDLVGQISQARAS